MRIPPSIYKRLPGWATRAVDAYQIWDQQLGGLLSWLVVAGMSLGGTLWTWLGESWLPMAAVAGIGLGILTTRALFPSLSLLPNAEPKALTLVGGGGDVDVSASLTDSLQDFITLYEAYIKPHDDFLALLCHSVSRDYEEFVSVYYGQGHSSTAWPHHFMCMLANEWFLSDTLNAGHAVYAASTEKSNRNFGNVGRIHDAIVLHATMCERSMSVMHGMATWLEVDIGSRSDYARWAESSKEYKRKLREMQTQREHAGLKGRLKI